MFICMMSLSMLNFFRLNQRKMSAVRIGDASVRSDGGGSKVRGGVRFISSALNVCPLIKPQERRPDVAPPGRVRNE